MAKIVLFLLIAFVALSSARICWKHCSGKNLSQGKGHGVILLILKSEHALWFNTFHEFYGPVLNSHTSNFHRAPSEMQPLTPSHWMMQVQNQSKCFFYFRIAKISFSHVDFPQLNDDVNGLVLDEDPKAIKAVDIDGCRRRRPRPGRGPVRFRCEGNIGPPCTVKRGDTVFLNVDFESGNCL